MKHREYLAEQCTIFVFGISLSLELWVDGMKPWLTPDSAGYLARNSCPACLGQPRIPLYGWLVNAIASNTGGYGWVPWLQFLLFAACSVYLVNRLRELNIGRSARAAVGISIGLSNLVLIWCRAIMPTLPAVSFLFLAISGVIWMTAQGRKKDLPVYVLIGVSTTFAWLFDPGLLPFIVVLPLLYWSLAGVKRRGQRFLKSSVIFLCCLAPFLAISSLRAAEVGNFGIVSFGGFTMSGMASLILSPATADRLAPRFRPLATAILTGRTAQEQNGTTIATPANSVGERSFVSEATGYFDILARTHDTVLYGVVAVQRKPGESWVEFNARLQRFAVATIKAEPVDYAAWVWGGLSRLIGRAIIMNPIFMLSASLALILFVVSPNSAKFLDSGQRIAPMVLMNIWYFIGATLLAVVITFPAQRYVDVGSVLMASLPIYTLIRQSLQVTPHLKRLLQ